MIQDGRGYPQAGPHELAELEGGLGATTAEPV